MLSSLFRSSTKDQGEENKKKGLQKQKVSHEVAIEYNSYGVPVGKGRNDLRSYIGVLIRETISILLDDWRRVPLEMKETLWVHFQKKFKLSLKCKSQEKSKKAKDKRAKNVYNHCLGSTGYGVMLHRKKKESGVSEREIDRSEAWLMARADRDGKYASDVTPIAEKINELKSQVEQGTFQSQGSHDILGEALQK
ncbi:hypothetical protein CUMW_164240 [Citrus unshiu]|nr:hypothetical protein CUMW_164240 [Citrus unshiu]